MQLTLTPLADAGVTLLPPDIVWNGRVGDFAVSVQASDGPVGGLVAAHPIGTAIILILFSDAPADPDTLRIEHRGDRRGWPGDGFDVDTAAGEGPLGSTLWLFRRHELLDSTGMEIEAEVERALQTLIRQGVAASVTVAAEVEKASGRVSLAVGVYGRDGAKAYSAKFDILWRQLSGGL